jgi:hypothetical protein
MTDGAGAAPTPCNNSLPLATVLTRPDRAMTGAALARTATHAIYS